MFLIYNNPLYIDFLTILLNINGSSPNGSRLLCIIKHVIKLYLYLQIHNRIRHEKDFSMFTHTMIRNNIL